MTSAGSLQTSRLVSAPLVRLGAALLLLSQLSTLLGISLRARAAAYCCLVPPQAVIRAHASPVCLLVLSSAHSRLLSWPCILLAAPLLRSFCNHRPAWPQRPVRHGRCACLASAPESLRCVWPDAWRRLLPHHHRCGIPSPCAVLVHPRYPPACSSQPATH